MDSLEKLNVLDDITITAEERFRARHFSKSNEHPKDFAKFKISFGTIHNVPPTIPSEVFLFIHSDKITFEYLE